MSRTAAPFQGWRRRAAQTGLLLVSLLAAGSALALTTTSWATTSNTSASTTVNGITVTLTGQASEAYSNGTFNSTNRWSDPYGATVAGR